MKHDKLQAGVAEILYHYVLVVTTGLTRDGGVPAAVRRGSTP